MNKLRFSHRWLVSKHVSSVTVCKGYFVTGETLRFAHASCSEQRGRMVWIPICKGFVGTKELLYITASLVFGYKAHQLQKFSWVFDLVYWQCSSHTSTTATCEQSRPKQGDGKDQASDSCKWLPYTWKLTSMTSQSFLPEVRRSIPHWRCANTTGSHMLQQAYCRIDLVWWERADFSR